MRADRWRWVGVIGLMLCAGLISIHLVTGFPDPMEWTDYEESFADAVAYLMATRAAWDGNGAATPTDELARMYEDIPDFPYRLVYPQMPAALLVQAPTLAMSPTTVVNWGAFFTLATLGVVVAACASYGHIKVKVLVWLAPLIAVSPQLIIGYEFGKFGTGAIPLVVAGLLFLNAGRFQFAGLAFGTAAALQAWPAILLVALLRIGQKRATAAGFGIALLLTIVALALPGVDLFGTVSGLRVGGLSHVLNPTNGSLAGLISFAGIAPHTASILGLLVGAGLWILGIRLLRDDSMIMGWSIVCGLLASPLSWGLYWLTALPVAARLMTTGVRTSQLLAGLAVMAILLSFAGFGLALAGLLLLGGFLVSSADGSRVEAAHGLP